MLRDIDYAATAVQRAIVEKFGQKTELEDLQVTAQEKTILIQHGQRRAEGTRDDLLAAIRKADTLDDLWQAPPGRKSAQA